MSYILPPLRKKVMREIFKIVFFFGGLGFILITVVNVVSPNHKKLIAHSEEFINQTIIMFELWDDIYINSNYILKQNTKLNKKFDFQIAAQKFEIALSVLTKMKNSSEEKEVISKVEQIWKSQNEQNKGSVSEENYIILKDLLKNLIKTNQIQLMEAVKRNISHSKEIAVIVSILFLFALAISIYFSEKLSSSIALPLKKITEALQNKPKFNQKLKMPEPSSLEVKVLIAELNELWKTISEFNKQNMHNLASQKKEMEVIFSAMEDAALYLNSQNKIQYFNNGFLDILAIQDEKLIYEHDWDDLPLMTDSYLQLRKLLRKEHEDEILFTCKIHNEDRIYRSRKKIIHDGNNKKSGVILLLHDITKKLPTNKFQETLQALKVDSNEI